MNNIQLSRNASPEEVESYLITLADRGLDAGELRPIVQSRLQIIDDVTPEGAQDGLPPVMVMTPDPHEALDYLSPAQVTELFENENLNYLSELASFVLYLDANWTPLYTLDELHDNFHAFINFLKANTGSIIEYGKPDARFSGSSWLSYNLSNLYIGHINEQARDFLAMGYTLSRKDARRISADRGKLLELKLNVLEELVHALSTRDAIGLFNECLDLITKCLQPDELEYYLQLDLHYPEPIDSTGSAANPLGAGGVLALLNIVGHVEKEISVGTLKRMISDGQNVIHFRNGRWAPQFRSYYKFIEHGADEPVRKLYSLYQELDAQECVFWTRYRELVDMAIRASLPESSEFRNDVLNSLSPSIQQPGADGIQSTERMQWIKPLPSTISPSIFEFFNDYRNVKFHGDDFDLSDTQALVIKILHHSYEQGLSKLSFGALQTQIGELKKEGLEKELSIAKISNVFRKGRRERQLIKFIGRNHYSLNI